MTDQCAHCKQQNYLAHVSVRDKHREEVMEGGEDKKKRRRPNFSEQELHAMVIAVSEKQDILSGKFYHDHAANTTTTSKSAVWQYVADAVNKLSRVQRDANEVRTKYKHFKSEVKKKRASEKKQRAGTGTPVWAHKCTFRPKS